MVNLVYTNLTRGIEEPVLVSSRDRRIRWCHLSTIPGTTSHCLVSTEGNVDFLGTRNLVYHRRRIDFVILAIVTFSGILRLNRDTPVDNSFGTNKSRI